MRRTKFGILASLLLLASCRSATGPFQSTSLNSPISGSTYVYEFDQAGPSASDKQHTTRTAEIVRRGSDSSQFSALWRNAVEDSINIENYYWAANGDLGVAQGCNCGDLAYPFFSHGPYAPPDEHVVTKQNGFTAPGYLTRGTDYLGDDVLYIKDHPYTCTKAKYTMTTTVASGMGPNETITISCTTIFWFSKEFGFFLREETTRTDSPGVTQTLMLTDWKLS